MQSIIKDILGLPQKFYESGNNLSMYDLLKQTHYIEVQGDINDVDFQKSLIEHPEYVNGWLAWSDNKRSSSGWFLEVNPYGQYAVGYLDSKMGRMNERSYPNAISACAYFISKEIDNILQQ